MAHNIFWLIGAIRPVHIKTESEGLIIIIIQISLEGAVFFQTSGESQPLKFYYALRRKIEI